MAEDHKTVIAPATVLAPKDPAKVGDKNIAPNTTAADDLMTSGQRKINLLWETTQAVIAIMVTGATLYVAARLAINNNGDTAPFLLLSNAFFVVISTYLARTNHTKTGGVSNEKRRGE